MALNTHIETLCKELQLSTINDVHHEIANRAAKESWKYGEYLYELLKLEANNRAVRSRATLTKMAGFPTIKTLEQFDFNFTVGVNRRQIEELSTLEFRVQIKICTKADTDSLIGLNFSFPSPAGALSA